MKKAIVVGATSGIGKALAIILAGEGYKVGITGRRKHLLDELTAQYPDAFIARDADVADLTGSIAALKELANRLGGLDLVVISSGTGDLNDALDPAIELNTVDTNVRGFTAIADWAFNYFAGQKSGHLVAITSVAAMRGSRIAPAYNASKAFQLNYLEGLRQKATKLDATIFVTDIRPGFVNTAMAKGEGQFWVAPVSKAAHQILSAIKRRAGIVYITRRWWLVARVLKMIPGSIYKRM